MQRWSQHIQDTRWQWGGGAYLSTEMQLAYSAAPIDWD